MHTDRTDSNNPCSLPLLVAPASLSTRWLHPHIVGGLGFALAQPLHRREVAANLGQQRRPGGQLAAQASMQRVSLFGPVIADTRSHLVHGRGQA